MTQPAGVERVGRLVENALAGTGFAWERAPVHVEAERWLSDLMLPGSDPSALAPVLVGRRAGRDGRVLLLGDLDTAFEPGALSRFPLRVENGRAYGPGVADMKGGLVVLVTALRALPRDAGPSLTVVLSSDEQAGSLGSRAVIEREAVGATACLCVECARNGGELMGARSHIGVARIDVRGREAHAGSAFASGASAIDQLAHHVIALRRITDPARRVFITVGQIGGGRRRSVVPGHAWCTIDVRTPDADAWADTERRIRDAISAKTVPGTATELRIYAHRPAVRWHQALVDLAVRAGRGMGVALGVGRSAAAGSSAFPGGLGVPTLDGLGPAGGDLMTDHEYIDVKSIGERALVLARTLELIAAEREALSYGG